MGEPLEMLNPHKPFLTSLASARTPCPPVDGYYSSALQMWAVNIDGQEVPIIDHNNSLADITTKTKAQQETDDDRVIFSNLTELATKTATQTEGDDQRQPNLLELATKTDAQLEHDDQSPTSSMYFF